MNIKELETKLNEIHDSAATARNEANDVLAKLSALRSWLTAEEIKRLKAKEQE